MALWSMETERQTRGFRMDAHRDRQDEDEEFKDLRYVKRIT